MSGGIDSKLEEKDWCPASAIPISTTASHIFSMPVTNSNGNTQQPESSIVTLRAKLGVRPFWISLDESQPPAMLPTSERRYMMIIGSSTTLRSTS